ncbi:MAG: phosphoserine phosphatase RsbU/P [Chthoniobacter sp.]|jgi:sigma-B regulation protein RsbU (phosphoserine phosphatase)|nr:phosphoserine phosphatase RsbU/P [Chthoniobacter sp.]
MRGVPTGQCGTNFARNSPQFRLQKQTRVTDPLKILIVDDDALSRKLLTRLVEAMQFEVIDCRDGAEALQILENSGPALLVLDYEMPEFNGAEICDIVRQDRNPAMAQIPIILLTAHSNAEHEVECLRAGANDFVTKPVNPAVLRARIETHLRLYELRQQLTEQNRELESWRREHERDLEAAQLTQRAILPARLPAIPGWEFAAHYHPLIQVGGDIYDWVKARDGSLLVWISDATGHGASAALLTTLSKLLFRHAASELTSAAAIMDNVNEEFQGIFKGRSFMTAACMVVGPDQGGVTFCGAGHPPLLVARSNGRIDEMPSSSPPLGVNGHTQCDEQMHEIEEGDALLLYTDGLYEVQNVEGERLTQRALAQGLAPASGSAQKFLTTVIEKATAHAGGRPFPDDIAVFAAVRI